MLFNSFDFAVFLPLTFALYWLLRPAGRRVQNVVLLVAGYVFYAWWDWRFVGLLLLSSVVDYWVGIGLSGGKRRKLLLAISLTVNLGMLALFKYFDFFAAEFAAAFRLFGSTFDPWRLGYVLPVGISFYTFQTLSYSIDVYRRRVVPTRDWVAFFAFVNFFPQLVAGPVERASSLLPQFLNERVFRYPEAVAGLRFILWGLFAKMVVADHCAGQVNYIFEQYERLPGGALFLGAFLFAVQIYGDFMGYSAIAIGVARLFGFRLLDNFRRPYFAVSIPEFWRRWHISLSTWFRDYVYIPLGGNRGGAGTRARAILGTFLLSGLWHGANWTFLAWGLVHALLYLAARAVPLGKGWGLPRAVFTFLLVTLAWVLFRAPTIGDAVAYLARLCDFTSWQSFPLPDGGSVAILRYAIPLLFLAEALNWDRRPRGPRPLRWVWYACLISVVFLFGVGEEVEFIYFSF